MVDFEMFLYLQPVQKSLEFFFWSNHAVNAADIHTKCNLWSWLRRPRESDNPGQLIPAGKKTHQAGEQMILFYTQAYFK